MTETIKNRYTDGKIYTIRCNTDDTLIYVGSTIQPLSKRFSSHKKDCNNEKGLSYNTFFYTSIRENGGISNFYYELYEDYPCNNRNELDRREGEITRQISSLNKNIAGRTKKEYKSDHQDEIQQYQQQYQQKYQLYNKESIQHKNNTKYKCDVCDGRYTYSNKSAHMNSPKHTKLLTTQ